MERINPTAVAAGWRKSFGDFPPLGYVCRTVLEERWLRIHSLPESKRYAETEAEYREILRRHNEAATEILGERGCVLFVGRFDGDHDSDLLPELEGTTFARVPGLDAMIDPEEQTWVHFHAAHLRWATGRFDTLLRDVADDRSESALFADLRKGRAFAPYDGGADLFLESPAKVAELKARWEPWLSARSDGL